MLILFTYKLLKGYLTCLKLNQFGFRWMCSRWILGDITPRTRRRCSRPGKGFYRKSCYRRIYRAAPYALYESKIVSRLKRYRDKHATYRDSIVPLQISQNLRCSLKKKIKRLFIFRIKYPFGRQMCKLYSLPAMYFEIV